MIISESHREPLQIVLIDAVLLDDFAVMEHIELLRGVFTCEQHDRFLAARMVRQESYTSSPTMTQ